MFGKMDKKSPVYGLNSYKEQGLTFRQFCAKLIERCADQRIRQHRLDVEAWRKELEQEFYKKHS